ncbi:MAG: hypothetical protein MZW92_38555 [Comamonadaceae bacterium]|nr:hypothetical protein [Comamonadaceae bacterium]
MAIPASSHNYHRDHLFNLWFTIAVPPASDLGWTVGRLHEMAEAESTRLLPTLQALQDRGQARHGGRQRGRSGRRPHAATPGGPRRGADGLQPLDVAVIRELQEDRSARAAAVRAHGPPDRCSEEAFLAAAGRLRTQGYMRRMAGVLPPP